MKKTPFFLVNFLLAAIKNIWCVIIALILIIIGAIWSDTCIYIGLFFIALNLILALFGALHMQKLMNYRSEDDPEFNELMDKLSADPKAFFSEIIETKSRNKQLHGEELLTLSDDDLFETVYMQILDMTQEADDTSDALKRVTGARKTVYILSLFDMEINNGGLCQFFVNSSRAAAPYVKEALALVGATEHLELFEGFVTSNNLDLDKLESFKIFSMRGFAKQSKRCNFDDFDDKYYELPPLQNNIVAFIKNNINEF